MQESDYHILIVDDNEDILFMLNAMLKFKGYKVSISENAENIQNSIAQLMPDIILMDMLLSGVDGRDVCKSLKMNPSFSTIPLIMISAHPQAKEKCLEAGVDFFLAKPFEMNDLFQTVSNALSLKEANG